MAVARLPPIAATVAFGGHEGDALVASGLRAAVDGLRLGLGRQPVACVLTFGCQMNESDSEKIAGVVLSMGYRLAPPGPWLGGDAEKRPRHGYAGEPSCEFAGLPDFVVINTCGVRENAERKLYGALGACKRLKRAQPGLIVAVCGCMAHMPTAVSEINEKYRVVNYIFGTDGIWRLPALHLDALRGARRALLAADEPACVVEGAPMLRKPPPTAFVPAMYGCANHCAYCVVPFTRGPERSRELGDILAEAEGLAASGYTEVMLLGQNVNAYGKDRNTGSPGFPELLRRVAAVSGIARVRFMTSHPKDLSDELIDAIAQTPKVERRIHLPVQSGSDAVLARMNRRYTRESYLRLVDRIRSRVPDAAISTDIIVGFPGETDCDFADTMDLVERVRFDAAFTFIYSKRPGTPAAVFGGQVGKEEVERRFRMLLEAQNRICLESNLRLVGQTHAVLLEGASKTDPGTLTGRTSQGKIVNFPPPGAGIGVAPSVGGHPGAEYDAIVGASRSCQGANNRSAPAVGAIADVVIEGARTWALSGRLASEAPESWAAPQ